MSWKRIKRVTRMNYNVIDLACFHLTQTCDWVQPQIKQLPRNVCGSDIVAWDVQGDDEYPILVFVNRATLDNVAIPEPYADEDTEFTTDNGLVVKLVSGEDDYELQVVEA